MTKLPDDIERSVEMRTRMNLDRIERVMMLLTPSRKLRSTHEARRAAMRQCKACYYLGGARIAGQAFTEYRCGICELTYHHPNTATPKYCDACCAAHELCQTCSGRIEP